jgi:hypothetical protein
VNKDEVILRFKDSALARPILRKCTKAEGVTEDPMPKATFIAVFKSSLSNAGYFWGLSIHAVKRYLGEGVDSKCLFFVCQRALFGHLRSLVLLVDLQRCRSKHSRFSTDSDS